MSTFDLKHALAVASEFEYGTHEWLVALLHDSVEDGVLTYGDIGRVGGLSNKVIEDVLWLTRHHGETYEEYIASVGRRDVPRRVKLADLKANLARMDAAHESLRSRYEKALSTLEYPRT